MQNEILGTANVERLFSRSSLLHPDISKNDKGLSWDGHVDVYRSARNNQPKSNLLYQVPIQVKGHEGIKPSERPDKFDIELADLRNYQAKGGTLFFKVSFDSEGKNEVFYYKALLPGDIDELLNAAPHQKTTRFQLDPFPTDVAAVEDVLTAFAKAMKSHTEGSALRWKDFAPADSISRRSPLPSTLPKPKDPYSYNAEVVPFQGREEEKEQLRAFMEDERPFCWWAIVGPGGAGKTRLAYEFQKELKLQGHWTVEKLGASRMHDLPKLSREEFLNRQPGPTLLIMDYAQQFASQLGEWLDRLTADDWEWEPDAPLRLLLLERAEKDSNGRYPWEKELLQKADSYRLLQARFSAPHELLAEKELVFRIMEKFAVYLQEIDKKLPKLTKEEIQDLSEQLQDMEERSRTPLFAMLLVDAALHKALRDDWSWETLLIFRIDREKRLLENRLRKLVNGGSLIRNAALELWRVATVLGTAGDPEWADLQKLLPTSAEHIRRAAEEARQTEEELLQALDLLDDTGEYVHALRPDLFGEYMILDWLRNGHHAKGEIERFFGAILSDSDAVTTFFLRVLRDFTEIIRNPEGGYHDWLIPAGMALRDSQAARLTKLLLALFNGASIDSGVLAMNKQKEHVYAKENSTRVWLMSRMAEYTEAVREETTDAAIACYRLAYVYQAMGDYENALKYYCKSLKIRENELGLSHPIIGDIYDNLAIVYQNMDNYDKALEYAKKSMKLHESVFSPEHPSAAGSYSTLAVLYKHMGDYEMALEYYNKVLKIQKTKFGPEHLKTAFTYNNLAVLYRAMGDNKNALECYGKAMMIWENEYGSEHPTTASCYYNLACLYFHEHNYDEALHYSNIAFEVFQRVFGPEHPNTLLAAKLAYRLMLETFLH